MADEAADGDDRVGEVEEGVSPTVTKLTETWKAEQRACAAHNLSGVDYVYLCASSVRE